tara:strand:- start:8712 stop:8891 length:180 start_codon:yes stop_codon:yes gene_type:complete
MNNLKSRIKAALVVITGVAAACASVYYDVAPSGVLSLVLVAGGLIRLAWLDHKEREAAS